MVLQLKLQYDGDLRMTVKTKAQINPLYASQNQSEELDETSLRHSNSSADNRPFVVPVFLSISQIQFDAYILVTVDLKGGFVQLSYCNTAVEQCQEGEEPFFHIQVNSTFDDVPVIRKYLQSLIEGKIKQFLCVDMLELVYNSTHDQMTPFDITEYLEHCLGNESLFKESKRNCYEIPHDSSLEVKLNTSDRSDCKEDWSFNRDDFLSACYASPEGLFVVERRLLAPFTAPIEIQQRFAQFQTDPHSTIQTNEPVVISFPFNINVPYFIIL